MADSGAMRFDYYSAGVPEEPQKLIEALRVGLGATEVEGRPRGLRGYASQTVLRRGDITVATVLHGGNAGAMPNVFQSNECAHALAVFLRGSYPGHRVTRMDAAQDFDGPGAWDRLYALAMKIAVASRLKITQSGDWFWLVDGRTVYFGSWKSAVFVRLYEKGKQLGADITGIDGAGGCVDVRSDWCRIEVVVKPDGDARYRAASAAPQEAWGYSWWTAKMWKAISGSTVPRVSMQQHRIPDHERSFLHMVDQYGDAMERLRVERGWSSEQLGRVIQQLIDRKKNQRANWERSRAA